MGLWSPVERAHFAKDSYGTLVFYPNGLWLDLIAKRVEAYVISSDGEYQRLRWLIKRLVIYNLLLVGLYLYAEDATQIKGLFVPFVVVQHFGRRSIIRKATKDLPLYRAKTSAEALLHGARRGRRPYWGRLRLALLGLAPLLLGWLQLVWMPRLNWHHGVARTYLVFPLFAGIVVTLMLLIVIYERLLGAQRFYAWKTARSMLCAHNVLLTISCALWAMLYYVRFLGPGPFAL